MLFKRHAAYLTPGKELTGLLERTETDLSMHASGVDESSPLISSFAPPHGAEDASHLPLRLGRMELTSGRASL
eukprot:5026040-Amphidinium_carterae.1